MKILHLSRIVLQNVLKPERDMPVERQPGVVEPKSHEREQKVDLKVMAIKRENSDNTSGYVGVGIILVKM